MWERNLVDSDDTFGFWFAFVRLGGFSYLDLWVGFMGRTQYRVHNFFEKAKRDGLRRDVIGWPRFF